MSGSKSRLGNRSYATGGLLKSVADKVRLGEESLQKRLYGEIRPLNQNVYFKADYYEKTRNPLLVIYPVQLKPRDGDTDDAVKQQAAAINIKDPLIGISVGIPAVKGKEPKQYQYKINLVKYRELAGLDEPDEADDTIED